MENTSLPQLTPGQQRQLQAYAALLRQWTKKINLIAPSTLAGLEQRHVADSAQLAPHLPQESSHIVDVGTGAGLPGLVLAILAPQHTYTLVERDQRKAAFLRTAIHQLGLGNVTLHAADVATLAAAPSFRKADVITCRAWASMAEILAITHPLLASSGYWLLLKGQALDAELSTCETPFHLTTERWPSIVSGRDGERGWVVKMTPSP